MSLFDRIAKPATPAPTPAAAPSGGSAVSLEKVSRQAPGLVNLYKSAGVSLDKSGLSGVRMPLYLVADHSGSMSSYYRSGIMQSFSEMCLAAAAHLDDDGEVPVILFDSSAHAAVNVDLSNYAGAMQRITSAAGRMGTTDYAKAINAVVALHNRSTAPGTPGLVIFQTDGNPDSRRNAERALCEAAKSPLFFSFVGFGRETFDFLRKLDELPVPKKRVIDNASFFSAGVNPLDMPAEQLYSSLVHEVGDWLSAAKAAGIVR